MATNSSTTTASRRAPFQAIRSGSIGVFRYLAVLSVLATVLGGTASLASASVRASERVSVIPERAVASTSTFCADALKSEKTTATPTPADTAAYLANAFKQMKADESLVLGISPAQLKSDWQTLFAYTTKIYNALAAVNYNYAKLSPTAFASLLTGSKSVEAASEAIATYLKKDCGITH